MEKVFMLLQHWGSKRYATQSNVIKASCSGSDRRVILLNQELDFEVNIPGAAWSGCETRWCLLENKIKC